MSTLDKLKEQAPNLEFELPDGTPVVKLGLIVTLYFKEGYTAESKKKVMECYERFYAQYHHVMKSQYYERYKKITSSSFEKARNKILAKGPNEQYHWYISNADNAGAAGDYSLCTLNSFEVHGDKKRSYIKLVMPWSLLLEEGKRGSYHEWLVYLCNQVNADHGYGGLSSVLPYDYDGYMPTEYQLAQKYPGLEVDSLSYSLGRELLNHIKGVNWFTVLGNTYVERLGGEHAVRHALSGRGDIQIQPYNNGLIIQAGEYPELGAVEDGLPSAYVAVNKVVKPVRIPNPDQLHTYSPYGDCFDQESTNRWYARFDQEDEKATPSSILAGQPCSREGYWFTPAQANSRRHFNKDEIMPAIDDSKWGATLWYWSGEGSA